VIRFEETVMVFEEMVIKTTSPEYPCYDWISPIWSFGDWIWSFQWGFI